MYDPQKIISEYVCDENAVSRVLSDYKCLRKLIRRYHGRKQQERKQFLPRRIFIHIKLQSSS
jgi:hypothetical protein